MRQPSFNEWGHNNFRPMNNIEKILKWIREVNVKTLPYDVLSIGWGPQKTNNIDTGEYGIIFTVKEKKPIEDLKTDQIIPKNLEIPLENLENILVKTDVIEPVFCKKLPALCHTNSNTIDPVKQNRIRRRPLIGGIEAMTDWGNYVGTLGILVKDKSDGQIVALSNNHVFANSQITALFKTPNEQNFTTTTKISGYQPTGYWRTTSQNDYIGKCKKAVMIGDVDSSIITYIDSTAVISETSSDAAILELSNYNLIDPLSSANILNFDVKAPYQFATDSEIDSLAPLASNSGAPVFRSGRTLGPIGSPGNTYSCGLSVYQLNWALVGTYSGYASYFSNCFYVRGNVDAGADGDSGSAMFALFNRNNPSLSAWKLIGLLFAGPDDSSYTIGCRITNIANALNIGSWDTKIPNLSSRISIIALTDNFSQNVSLSGRTYYQSGYK
jgi:hypothetical protein